MKIIAIKLLQPSINEIQDESRYHNIVKGLNSFKPYYLYSNYELTNDIYLVKTKGEIPPFIDNFKNPLKKNFGLSINVCAIVGKNGSGKSTIIELIIRLINNFACSIIGDNIIFNSAHPLHFVPDIFAELYYEKDGIYYKIKQQGNKISFYEMGEEVEIYSNTHNGNEWEEYKISPILKESELRYLFYTIVINYSHYSYNLYDFEPEWSSAELMKNKLGLSNNELAKRRKAGKPEIDDVERCWLTGIFHKNDGYQTPIVLNPYRYDGNINIKSESDLENDRLLSLILTLDNNNQSIFTEIIENKIIHSLDINYNPDHKITSNIFKTEKLKYFYNLIKRPNINFIEIYDEIILYWSKQYKIDFSKNFHVNADESHEYALNYLVYKTLRITSQYKEYSFFYSDLINNKRKLSLLIRDLIMRIDEDKSHITLKIRQTINFLICNHFHCVEKKTIEEVAISLKYSLDEGLSKNIGKLQQKSSKTLNSTAIDGSAFANFKPTMIDMLPPPFFKVEMNLIEKNKLDEKTFKFSTLSSGEKQMTYTIGSLLYHLKNVDSVKDRGETDDLYYKHINVILEEIELYYHPEMQRKLLSYILESIQKLEIKTLSLQIILITHSPFVLSDIPCNNVLYLKDGKSFNEERTESFGANIFELLRDNFYLNDGPIGVHSYNTLKEMFKLLNKKRINNSDFTSVKNMTQYIGEPFLKQELKRLIYLKENENDSISN
jgi:ABC-type multidrug transport system ATPase subunit